MHKDSGLEVCLFNLYVPILFSKKRDCWDLLREFLSSHQLENIILGGDLNITLALEEKKGGTHVRDPAREWVEDIILAWDLEDIKPTQGKFTWSNKRLGPSHIASRLDRFLVQSSFLLFGLKVSSRIMAHSTSDHKPILLEFSKDQNLGPIPFRFSPTWIQYEGFQELVSLSWKEPVRESLYFVWEEKLRRLKKALKSWAKSLKPPGLQRQEAQSSLEDHQPLLEDSIITQDMLAKEATLQSAFHQAYRQEEEYWR